MKKVLIQVLKDDKDQIVKRHAEYEREKKNSIDLKKTLIECFKQSLKEKHDFKVKKTMTGGFGMVFYCDKLEKKDGISQVI